MYCFFVLINSDRLRAAEVLLFVDLDAAVGADKLGVLVELIDLSTGFGRFHLAHMQFAVLLGIQTIIFSHNVSP